MIYIALAIIIAALILKRDEEGCNCSCFVNRQRATTLAEIIKKEDPTEEFLKANQK